MHLPEEQEMLAICLLQEPEFQRFKKWVESIVKTAPSDAERQQAADVLGAILQAFGLAVSGRKAAGQKGNGHGSPEAKE